MENILRWVAGIFSTLRKPTGSSSRPKHPATDIAAGTRAGNTPVEADATRAEDVIATSTATTSIATVSAAAKIDRDARVSDVVPTAPDEDEIKRRRELIRRLFNDFWSGRDDKPVAFVDRLNEAEVYLNERLIAGGGSFWELDGISRKMLGLPARSKSRNQGNGAA